MIEAMEPHTHEKGIELIRSNNIMYDILSTLEVEDIVRLCSTDRTMKKMCEDPWMWDYYLRVKEKYKDIEASYYDFGAKGYKYIYNIKGFRDYIELVSLFLKNFPDKKTFINRYTIEDEESLKELFPDSFRDWIGTMQYLVGRIRILREVYMKPFPIPEMRLTRLPDDF